MIIFEDMDEQKFFPGKFGMQFFFLWYSLYES